MNVKIKKQITIKISIKRKVFLLEFGPIFGPGVKFIMNINFKKRFLKLVCDDYNKKTDFTIHPFFLLNKNLFISILGWIENSFFF